jgi:hypothetical protein
MGPATNTERGLKENRCIRPVVSPRLTESSRAQDVLRVGELGLPSLADSKISEFTGCSANGSVSPTRRGKLGVASGLVGVVAMALSIGAPGISRFGGLLGSFVVQYWPGLLRNHQLGWT